MVITKSTNQCLHNLSCKLEFFYKRILIWFYGKNDVWFFFRRYGIIKKHKNVLDIYAKKLVDEGCVTQEEVDAVIEKYDKICEEAYKKAASEKQVCSTTSGFG